MIKIFRLFAISLLYPFAASAHDEPLLDVLVMTCLTPAQWTEMVKDRRSLAAFQTVDGGHIYELILLENRWLLLFHGGPQDVCIVDQGIKMDFNPNLREHLAKTPPAP